MTAGEPLGVAVIGAGYWGPNLVRNFRRSEDWDLVAVCDLDLDRARPVLGRRSGVDVTAVARRGARPRRRRRGRDRDAGAHPPGDRAAGAAGRQARAGREAAGRQRRARAGDGRPGRASRASC